MSDKVTHNGLMFDCSSLGISENYKDDYFDAFFQSMYDGGFRDALNTGDVLNPSENRAVGHMLQRSRIFMKQNPQMGTEADHADKQLVEMYQKYADKHKHIIHIGIGGSYLGPRMLDHFGTALGFTSNAKIHFITSNDPIQWNMVERELHDVNSTDVLVIVCSKTFTTREVLLAMNFGSRLLHDCDMVAVTGNAPGACGHGINEIIHIPEWVGGRFSIWGGISLCIALKFGLDKLRDFQEGGASTDQMVDDFGFDEVIPWQMAMAEDYATMKGATSRCVVPYSESLRFLPAYIQQLEMESLGKPGGSKLPVWGEIGPDCQHSFFQMLHAGDVVVTTELVLVSGSEHAGNNEAAMAQSKAFVQNQKLVNITRISPSFFGLGQLIASYEFKVMLLGSMHGINAYDQPAVELGKRLLMEMQNDS